ERQRGCEKGKKRSCQKSLNAVFHDFSVPNASAQPLLEAAATQVGRIRARCLTARFPNPPVRTVHATFTAHGSRDRGIYGDFHFARIPPSPWCTACAFPGYLCTVSLPSPSGRCLSRDVATPTRLQNRT